jgi:hypothetical protein
VIDEELLLLAGSLGVGCLWEVLVRGVCAMGAVWSVVVTVLSG